MSGRCAFCGRELKFPAVGADWFYRTSEPAVCDEFCRADYWADRCDDAAG